MPTHLSCPVCGFFAPYLDAECPVRADGFAPCPMPNCGGVLRDVSRVPVRELAERHDQREADVPMPAAFKAFVEALDMAGL